MATFAVDPAGFGIDHRLFELVDFVLLTRPLEVAKRNDQLLLRMVAAKPPKPVFTQLAVPASRGSTCGSSHWSCRVSGPEHGLTVRVLGRREDDGKVSPGVAYQVEWPDGTDLVISGTELDETAVTARGSLEALLLSVRHGNSRVVGQRLAAGLTILDDVLECAAFPGADSRVTLQQAWELRTAFDRGVRSCSRQVSRSKCPLP